MADPHEVLGIDRGADEAAVERAYRRRVKETHPDRGGSMGAFLEVRMAYEALRSSEAASPDRPASEHGVGPSTTGATARSRGPAAGDAGPTATERTEPARVEYLDYDAIVDHGWSLSDDDLFESAADADLDPGDHGRFLVQPDETLLEAAEGRGFAWPYACRGGACANCAVAVADGDLSIPVNHVLPEDLVDDDIRLSCVGRPTAGTLQVVFNVKHLPDLEELRLPPHPFRAARGAGD